MLYGEIIPTNIGENQLYYLLFLFFLFLVKSSGKYILKKYCCIGAFLFVFSIVMHLNCGKGMFGKPRTSISETVQILILREVILCRGAKNISPQNSMN